MTAYARRAWIVLWKDLLTERRSKESLNALFFFALLLLFLFQFTLGPDRERLRAAMPGLLWLGFVLAGLLGLGRSFMLACRVLIAAPLAFWSVAASGITLTNRDTSDQTLVVIEGDRQSERTIKAGEKLELCEKSCVIRLPDGEDYEFDGKEIVSLEEGLLFLDNPEESKAQ